MKDIKTKIKNVGTLYPGRCLEEAFEYRSRRLKHYMIESISAKNFILLPDIFQFMKRSFGEDFSILVSEVLGGSESWGPCLAERDTDLRPVTEPHVILLMGSSIR